LEPKFIFFDLDDTLLDHQHAEKQALTDTYCDYAELQQASLSDWVSTYHSINKGLWLKYSAGDINRQTLQRQRFEHTLDHLGVDSTAFQEIGSTYMQHYRKHWQWISGAEQAFEKIRSTFDVGIITNGFAETQDLKFKRFDLYDRSQVTVISEQVGHMKPHPIVFEHASEQAGYQPEEILYVGDSYTSDIEGGAKAGWKTAWFIHPNNEAPTQTDPADFVFTDFTELTNKLSKQ
jgi:putative hydrolase of the HAD superfamily